MWISREIPTAKRFSSTLQYIDTVHISRKNTERYLAHFQSRMQTPVCYSESVYIIRNMLDAVRIARTPRAVRALLQYGSEREKCNYRP